MRARHTPSARPTRHALAAALTARSAAMKWNAAAVHEQGRSAALLASVIAVAGHARDGATFRLQRRHGGLCRTWGDYLSLLKQDLRGAQLQVRQLRELATDRGFAIP